MDPKVLYKVSYGLYIVSAKKEEKFNAQIANTVFQVTAEPPTIAVSINKENLTHEFIQATRVFAVSILAKETPLTLIGHFGFKSGRDLDKFEKIGYKTGLTGLPLVTESTIGYLEAEVINQLDVGTHTIFIGKVVEAQIIKDGEPMTYAYYHEVKRGTTPKSAPVHIKEVA
jgi:flavin reductase (DIM6/NTAB) family NADH-FMN oxidoreductase RutF